MKATCRHVSAPSASVLSYDLPLKPPGESGTWFHSLQATSHALHPMQIDVSVKNPIRGREASPYDTEQARVSRESTVWLITLWPLASGLWPFPGTPRRTRATRARAAGAQ